MQKSNMKKILSGNEAFARGAYEAGVKVVSSYPGTPSTEITESIRDYPDIYCEWATNEKVALEVGIGVSMAGRRAMVCMKHVGLNVASDPLMTVSYTGVNGGLVIVVADDPDMFSSQNEQDSRNYARFARLPMLEPSDSQEAKEFIIWGFDISERFSTPVIVRSFTRLSHSKSVVTLGEKKKVENRSLENDISKWVMVPANARKRHKIVEERLNKITVFNNGCVLNLEEINSRETGIICSGVVYQYVKEAFPEASVLKLSMVYPIAFDRVEQFSKKVSKLYVVEELDPFFETELKARSIILEKLNRDICGELSVDKIKKLFTKGLDTKEQNNAVLRRYETKLPDRPPSLCAGCSHRGIFYAIHKLKLFVAGDIGCYTLGLLPPLKAINSCVCMGASVSMAHGMDKATDGKLSLKSVAVIGDSTFLHTGLNGLINTVYNMGNSTVLILDNRTTGMTGHQPNPATGVTIRGEPAPKINFEVLSRAIGVKHVRIVDPFDIELCMEVLREEVARKEPSVIITNRPCLFADKQIIENPYFIDKEKCTGCKVCTKIGCPAIYWDEEIKQAIIDISLCTGCSLCVKVCRFGAISQEVL